MQSVLAQSGRLLIAAMFVAAACADASAQTLACPKSPSSATGRSFENQNLALVNFARADLTNANFRGATLKGVSFIHANLTGADFSGATFVDTGNPGRSSDFSFANLDSACFIGAKFNAPTYLTYATLTCADFSQTDISTGNAIFGDEPLKYTPPSEATACRTAFRQTTMNCEFIRDWRAFDLSGAVVSACQTQLSGRNFSGAVMSGVNLAGAVLDGTSFIGADLSRAVLDGASLQCRNPGGRTPQCVDLSCGTSKGPSLQCLSPGGSGTPQCVDMSCAKLQGASLVKANLTGASLYNAFLSDNDVNNNISNAASLRQAHLKNVNLAFAQLSGVDFTLANFYGNTPANNASRCATTQANDAGFTVGCASAHRATVAGTTFADAYLYGVDFTNADIAGANFNQAVLSGANFAAAKVGSFMGARTKFTRAHLQGTNLDQALSSLDADLTDAFVDFRNLGNLINIRLNGVNHNNFACSNPSTCKPPSGQDVCTWVRYPPTTLPAANTLITCPDGKPAGSGCGAADPGGNNPRWKSSLAIGAPPDPGPPPAWYDNDATYTPKTSDHNVICGGMSKNPRVINW